MKPQLTTEALRTEAATFAGEESTHEEPTLYGVTDGKAVGTYLEHKFQQLLHTKYTYDEGSSAKGIDLPGLNVDLNVEALSTWACASLAFPGVISNGHLGGKTLLSSRL